MVRIPQHIEEINSYNPGKPAAEQAAELGLSTFAELWNNENNLGVPRKAIERLERANAKLNRYPDPLSWELRERLAEIHGRKPIEFVIGNGSESILANLFKAFFTPSENYVTSQGTFVAVYLWAKAANVNFTAVPLTQEYGFDLDGMLDAIDEKTRMVYLSNINNPTGTMIPREDLETFLDSVREDIIVVIDEAYSEYSQSLSDDYPLSAGLNRPNVITLGTFSKAYGIAGMRVGYAIAQKPLADALNKVRMTFAPSLLAQEAAIGALEDTRFLKETLDINAKGIAQFKESCSTLGLSYAQPFGNFIMIDLHQEELAITTTEKLRQQGVFVRRLPAFGLPHCIRISTGTAEENQLFVKALKNSL